MEESKRSRYRGILEKLDYNERKNIGSLKGSDVQCIRDLCVVLNKKKMNDGETYRYYVSKERGGDGYVYIGLRDTGKVEYSIGYHFLGLMDSFQFPFPSRSVLEMDKALATGIFRGMCLCPSGAYNGLYNEIDNCYCVWKKIMECPFVGIGIPTLNPVDWNAVNPFSVIYAPADKIKDVKKICEIHNMSFEFFKTERFGEIYRFKFNNKGGAIHTMSLWKILKEYGDFLDGQLDKKGMSCEIDVLNYSLDINKKENGKA